MNVAEIKEAVLRNPKWKEDRYGNLVTESNDSKYRLHFNDRKVRFETQITISATEYSKESKQWVLVESDFYKNVIVTKGKSGRDGLKIQKRLIVIGE